MSMAAMSYALQNRVYKGEARLIFIAAGDCNGTVSARGAAYWLGCDEADAGPILEKHVQTGMLISCGDGSYIQPDIWRFVELHERSSAASYQTGYRKTKISKSLRLMIFERDGNRCHYCGSDRQLTIDHIIPERDGGSHEPDNLLTACKSCNCSKGTKPYDEFVAWREEVQQ
ncbi:HNH endonuclease [Falsigemmobacter intermedius]|nr:HNH endonuclease [Falsigemmobacter intermedius]